MIHNVRTIAQTHFMDVTQVVAFSEQQIAKNVPYVWREGSEYVTNTWYADDFITACKQSGIKRNV